MRHQGHTRQASFALPLILALLILAEDPSALAHEGDSLGVTLKTWETRIWNRIADRDGNILGPREGILQRFDTQQDDEYRLDLRSYSFSVVEDFRWHQHDSGLRFWIGSLNNPELALLLEAKKSVPLGTTWSLQFQFFQERNLETDRNLPILTFEKREGLRSGRYVFATFHPKFRKASVDTELGGGYRWGPEAFVQASVATLDLFNDTVLALNRSQDVVASEEAEYLKEPYAVRTSANLPLGSRIRIELAGGLVIPSELLVLIQEPGTRREINSGRFTGESFFYGGLLEWRPLPWITSALAHTRVRAVEVEEWKTQEPAEDRKDRRLMEETRRLSVFFLSRPVRGLLAELWLEWIERPEERHFPKDPMRDVDHRDREFLGSFGLTYQLSRRVDLTTRYLTDDRDAQGIPKLQVNGHQSRLSVRTRVHFTPDTAIALGVNWELEYGKTLFDGGNLTLQSSW